LAVGAVGSSQLPPRDVALLEGDGLTADTENQVLFNRLLAALAKEEPCLSDAPLLESAFEQMVEKLRQLKALYGK
jgi:hypothetical protein